MCMTPMKMCVIGCLLLVPTGFAFGQIDHRTNQGPAAAAGHALDANLAVGSGGINQPAVGNSYGLQANSIVTGNVTGLVGFQGYSPVLQNNAFRASLPSADLASFNARSVGIPGVQAYNVGSPTYYFDRQETIADLGYIRGGLNMPGSSTLWSTHASPLPTGSLGVGVAQPSTTTPGQFGVQTPTQFGTFQQVLNPGAARGPTADSTSAYLGAAQSSIFGLPRPLNSTPAKADQTPIPLEGRPTLEALLNGQVPLPGQALRPNGRPAEGTGEPLPGAAEGEGAEPEKPGALAPIPQQGPYGTRLSKGSLTPGPGTESPGVEPAAKSGTPGPEAPLFGTRQSKQGVAGATPSAAGQFGTTTEIAPGVAKTPVIGQDRFADMFHAVRTAQSLGVGDLSFSPQPPAKAAAGQGGTSGGKAGDKTGESNQRKAREGRVLARRSDAAIANLASSARWAKDVLEEPLTTFVSANASKFNEQMVAAEQYLKAGEYFRAADHYALAHTLNPNDPLALLGRGHALAAAGEYMSATNAIVQGIKRFPQIAAFKLDLVALVGQTDIFDRRRADLEDTLAKSEQYELRFLLGYLELYSGLPEDGVRDLEQAAKGASQDSVIAAFPELLLGRETPASQSK